MAPAQAVTGGAPAPRTAAACSHCGTVTSVRVVKQQGEAGLIGPAAGTAVGGLIGSQIGHGSGRTVATIVGAAGGAAAGTEIERRYKSTTHHVVNVRLHDGTTRRFTYGSAPAFREGDRIRVVEGRLMRDS
jgi:outer membrane lipoprotein SlyB